MQNLQKYLDELNENKIDLNLKRIKKALSLLGNIQNQLNIIHVAGTNGKGSVSNLIAKILEKNCSDVKKVGLFTSPHIFELNERIKINDKNIENSVLFKYANFLKNFVTENKIDLTYFEFLTLLAIKYFVDENVDICVFECGLGGRLDSTNVFDSPLVSIITNIDFDHTQYLGKTLAKILDEKMGILRKNSVIVSGISQNKLRLTLAEKAKGLNANLFLLNRDFRIDKKNTFCEFSEHLNREKKSTKLKNINLKLRGEHQYKNLALALKTISILNKKFDLHFNFVEVLKTIKNFSLTGRLEFFDFSASELETNLLFDVAHNLAGLKTFFEYLKSQKKYRKIAIVFGILRDKNYSQIIQKFSNFVRPISKNNAASSSKIAKSEQNFKNLETFFLLTSPKSERALDVQRLKKEFEKQNLTDKILLSTENYDEILNTIKKNFSKEDLVCFVGSFYLISEFEKKIFSR